MKLRLQHVFVSARVAFVCRNHEHGQMIRNPLVANFYLKLVVPRLQGKGEALAPNRRVVGWRASLPLQDLKMHDVPRAHLPSGVSWHTPALGRHRPCRALCPGEECPCPHLLPKSPEPPHNRNDLEVMERDAVISKWQCNIILQAVSLGSCYNLFFLMQVGWDETKCQM